MILPPALWALSLHLRWPQGARDPGGARAGAGGSEFWVGVVTVGSL